MNEAWAYLAGIIDGEGCFSIAKAGKRRFPRVGMLTITNTDARLIAWLVDTFEGKPYLRQRQKNSRVCWNVCWSGRSVLKILDGVAPYLKVKGEQAATLEAFIGLLARRSPGRSRVIGVDNISERGVLAEAMTILNKGV